MMEVITELFSYPFVPRALLVGGLVSLCAALLGVVLVLKRYSLIGHGLADVGFAALAFALALGLPPMAVSVPVVMVASFLIMAVSQKKGVAGDAAIGVAATASLAAGILITAMTKGFNMDVYDYMFGSILAITDADVLYSVVLTILVLILFLLFYNRIFLITADEEFARSSGIPVTFYQFFISFLTALTVVVGMRMMGTLLISSLILFPAMTARKLVHSFKGMILVSGALSLFCFLLGFVLSFGANLPAGASIVAANVVVMAVVSLVSAVWKR